MFDFLKVNSPDSTMRVNVTLQGVGCFMILLAVAFHIVWYTLKKEPILWPQLSLLLGGIATLMTGVLWQKTEQKKVEIKDPNNIIPQ